jgi:uracil-DNA glycosylase
VEKLTEMEETFDAEALAKLVDEALSEEVPAGCTRLSAYEGRLLERLADVLVEQMGSHKAARVVLREVRDTALDGVKLDLPGLQRVLASCTRCPGLKHPPWPTLGNVDAAEVLVVVEALPSVDPVAIWKVLESVGIVRHRAALTGATRCSGAVTPTDIERCSEHLITEIEVLRPELILTMGSVPCQVLLGAATKVSEARGRLWWVGPWPVLPTYSMAYATRGARTQEEMYTDLALARRFLDG